MALPVKLTAAKLAARLRLTQTVAALPETSGMLTGYQTLARELMEQYAPDAPAGAATEAVLAIVGYLYDRPTAGSGARWANVWRNSGAASMLAPWRSRRGVRVL